MSTQNLSKFLVRLVKELETSKEFRSWANKQEHAFIFSGPRLKTQTIRQLNKKGIKVTTEQERDIASAANRTFAPISQKVQTSLARHEKTFGLSRHPETRFTNNTLTAVFEVGIKDTGYISNAFKKIKRTYKDTLDSYVLEVNRIIGSSVLPEKSGESFHAGHAQNRGVLETGTTEAAQQIAFEFEDTAAISSFVTGSRKRVATTLKALMAPSADRMEIIVESAVDNIEDSSKAKAKKTAFIQAAYKALERLSKGEVFIDFEGSDSPRQRKRKQAVKAVTTPFDKLKNVKVTTEDTEFNVSKGSATEKIIQNITRVKAPIGKYRSPTTGRFLGKQEGIESYLKIKDIINSYLAAKVADNMGAPKLEYRTGRFASSARVENIAPTEGSPMLSYSYMKYPYQTFELGFKQGSVHRDPRVVIEESIKEIAISKALGRFNIRRV